MRHGTRFALLATMLGLALGCQRSEPENTAPGTAETTEAQNTPTPATGDAYRTAPPAAAEPGQPPTGNGADLNVAESAERGQYLVDATGKALYMLDKDGEGTSTCADACATEWPPLLAAQGTPKAMDAKVRGDAIGTTKRPDGNVQVTYSGHPLYHFSEDYAAGQLNGHGKQDQFGTWHLVSPEGGAVGR